MLLSYRYRLNEMFSRFLMSKCQVLASVWNLLAAWFFQLCCIEASYVYKHLFQVHHNCLDPESVISKLICLVNFKPQITDHNKSRLQLSSAVMFSKPLGQTVPTQTRLLMHLNLQRAITKKLKILFFNFSQDDLLIIFYQLTMFEVASYTTFLEFFITSFQCPYLLRAITRKKITFLQIFTRKFTYYPLSA